MTSVLWLRRDLRLSDHPALHRAAEEGLVVPLFVRDPALAHAGDARRARLEASLAAFDDSTGGALVVRTGDPVEVVAALAAEAGARTVHVTGEHTPYARRRDRAVAERLERDDVRLRAASSPYAVAPGSVRSGQGTPYRVFTPYARAWRDAGAPPPVPPPSGLRWRRSVTGEELDAALVSRGREHGQVGEEAAVRRWATFRDSALTDYADGRDRPDLDGTSRLSAALRHGEIHPRTLLADLGPDEGPGARAFATELAWREFYADVLWHTPESAWWDLTSGLARMEYADADDPAVAPYVEAWRTGRTGFPFVDAGMRQLLESGWMHNRLRMVTASFLVKDLHVRWQVGARHFLDHLDDGDLASNNHGWQWVAGTGTDASPYFRIFNPLTQGTRFDPSGDFVRRWVPELRHLPGKTAHEPWRHDDGYAHGYAERIVDHGEERRHALDRYEAVRAGAGPSASRTPDSAHRAPGGKKLR
ncbi:deoxyribodipyrimidine photo-lyase [Nocardioides sp. zg-ZUI104]|uniref:cryptochrome/photolyase family protein n=1 Tax=Nocardioides faecalis TaxID=2803858 RepID=UPI001BCC6FB8|nr:deoxyribodipyrimidine photo-lyase [Nocardioides faecalis]MBS4752506.1 deoxyribodipyrimidine photo-lyase [Nocardioides faecalis]